MMGRNQCGMALLNTALVPSHHFAQKWIFDGISAQLRKVSLLAAVERVDFDALIERRAGNVAQLTGRSRQLEQPVSPRSVTSAIGHVGIWLEIGPIPPEDLTTVIQIW